jgi:transcriptional/translational regulatory protein YebC/TACO1
LPVEGEGGDSGMGISVESAENVQKAIELLEDEQDVVKVWTNLAMED